jgi:hypothetical protein
VNSSMSGHSGIRPFKNVPIEDNMLIVLQHQGYFMKNKTVSQDFYEEISAVFFRGLKSGHREQVVKTIYFVDCPNTMMLWKKT